MTTPPDVKISVPAADFVSSMGWIAKLVPDDDAADVLRLSDSDSDRHPDGLTLSCGNATAFAVSSCGGSTHGEIDVAVDGHYVRSMSTVMGKSPKGDLSLTWTKGDVSLRGAWNGMRFTVPITHRHPQPTPQVVCVGEVQCGEFFWNLACAGRMCMSSKAFGTALFTVAVDVVIDHSAHTMSFMGTDRYVLCHLVSHSIQAVDGKGEGVTLMDRRHLLIPSAAALASRPAPGVEDTDLVQMVVENMSGDADATHVRFGFRSGPHMVVYSLVDATPWTGVESMKKGTLESSHNGAMIPRGELSDAIRSVSMLAYKEHSVTVVLGADVPAVVSDSKGANTVGVDASDVVTPQNEQVHIVFNRELITRVLSGVTTPMVHIRWDDPAHKAVVFTPITEDGEPAPGVFLMAAPMSAPDGGES